MWNSLWSWLRGAHCSEGNFDPENRAVDVGSLIEGMKGRSQQERLSNLYGLAALGARGVNGLVETLLQTSDVDIRHIRLGKAPSAGSGHHLDRFFSDGQFTPEDSAIALGVIGAPSIEALIELFHHFEEHTLKDSHRLKQQTYEHYQLFLLV